MPHPGRVQLVTTRSLLYTRTGGASTGPEITASASAGTATSPAGLPGIDAVSARAKTENFRVASLALPKRHRSDLMALYRYARFVDEIGDSYTGDRLGALDWLESELHRGLEGSPGVHPAVDGVAAMARRKAIAVDPLLRLLEANRMDQRVRRYESFDQLLSYCELSANPVGRMVLQLFELDTPERVEWSDSICTGLQLVEHWQDVVEDATSGRVYLPAEDLRSFGVGTDDLTGSAPASPALRALMAFEARRARAILTRGSPLLGSLHGRVRVAIAGFWAGGMAALESLARDEFDPANGSRRSSRLSLGWHLGRALVAPGRLAHP